jgi:hypothetical protein
MMNLLSKLFGGGKAKASVSGERERSASAQSKDSERYSESGACDVCSGMVSAGQAYLVPVDVFYGSTKYHERLARMPMVQALGGVDAYVKHVRATGQTTPLAVCPDCIPLFQSGDSVTASEQNVESASASVQATNRCKTLVNEAATLGSQGKWAECVRVLKEALDLDPAHARAHMGLAIAYVGLMDPDGAREHDAALRRLDPGLVAEWEKTPSFALFENMDKIVVLNAPNRSADTAAVSGPIDQANREFELHGAAFLRHGSKVHSSAVSRDGNTAVTGDDVGNIKVWSLTDGRNLVAFKTLHSPLSCVRLTPDGAHVVVGAPGDGGDGGDLDVFDAKDGRYLKTMTFHNRWVYDVAFSEDGRLGVSTGLDWIVKVWKFDTAELLMAARHPDRGVAVRFQKGTRRVVSVSSDWTLNVWEYERFNEGGRLPSTADGWRRAAERAKAGSWEGGPGSFAIAISQTGRYVAITGGDSNEGFVIDTNSGDRAYKWQSRGRVEMLHEATNGSVVVWEKSKRKLIATHLQSGTSFATLEHPAEVKCAVVSDCGKYIVSGDEAGNVGVWKAVVAGQD